MSDSPPHPTSGSASPHDLVIVGGGLAGGLIALALQRQAPGCRFLVIEAGRTFGGHHRWSWFETDIAPHARKLMEGFALNGWDEGYDITFPGYGRSLPTSYRSLASAEFHAKLIAELPAERVMLGTKAAGLDARGVTLADGTRITAKRVIDCRPFRASEHLAGGWQVFLGQHFRCEEPHGLTRPVIMDASVDQIAPYGNGAAYRFVYVLPLSPTEVFVEDTYYADQPKMDADVLKGRVAEYAHRRGWKGEVIDQEAGILPVVSGGNFAAAQAEIAIPGVALAGARQLHPAVCRGQCACHRAGDRQAPRSVGRGTRRLLRAQGQAPLARHGLLPDAQPDAVRGRRARQARGGVRTFLRPARASGRTLLCGPLDLA